MRSKILIALSLSTFLISCSGGGGNDTDLTPPEQGKLTQAKLEKLENRVLMRWKSLEAHCNCSKTDKMFILGSLAQEEIKQLNLTVNDLVSEKNQEKIEDFINNLTRSL